MCLFEFTARVHHGLILGVPSWHETLSCKPCPVSTKPLTFLLMYPHITLPSEGKVRPPSLRAAQTLLSRLSSSTTSSLTTFDFISPTPVNTFWNFHPLLYYDSYFSSTDFVRKSLYPYTPLSFLCRVSSLRSKSKFRTEGRMIGKQPFLIGETLSLRSRHFAVDEVSQ